MDELRELDARCAELLGWTYHEEFEFRGYIYQRVWITPEKKLRALYEVPYYSKDPAACAELDGEMQKRGYHLVLQSFPDFWLCGYTKTPMAIFNTKPCEGKTECEARTRAAVRTLEGGS